MRFWLIAAAVLIGGCGKNDDRAPLAGGGGGSSGGGGSVVPEDTGLDSNQTSPDAAETSTTNEGGADTLYGQPDAIYESPPIQTSPPTPTDPLSFCTSDTLTLITAGTHPIAPTYASFTTAWNSQVKTDFPTTGPLTLIFTGLTSSPLNVALQIGSTDGNTPAGISKFAPGPASGNVTIDAKTRRLNGSFNPANMSIRFPSGGSAVDIPVGSITITGFLSAKCDSLSTVNIYFLIPASAASTPFAGSTLGVLNGPAGDESIDGAPAWPLALSGTATNAGG